VNNAGFLKRSEPQSLNRQKTVLFALVQIGWWRVTGCNRSVVKLIDAVDPWQVLCLKTIGNKESSEFCFALNIAWVGRVLEHELRCLRSSELDLAFLVLGADHLGLSFFMKHRALERCYTEKAGF
jgi:hypothetical protein